MSKIVDANLLEYLTDKQSDNHIGTLKIGPRLTEEFSEYSIQLQWIPTCYISFRIEDEHVVLRLDTIPFRPYFREWWWKIGSDVTCQLFPSTSVIERTNIESNILRRGVDFVARLCPLGFPDTDREAAHYLDSVAHRIGVQIKMALMRVGSCTRIFFKHWERGYGLGYVIHRRKDSIPKSPDTPVMVVGRRYHLNSSRGISKWMKFNDPEPGEPSDLSRTYSFRECKILSSYSMLRLHERSYKKRIEEGLIYVELASDAALGRMHGKGIFKNEITG